MSRKKHKKTNEAEIIELTNVQDNKEDNDMNEKKENIFVKVYKGLKGFFTSMPGKAVGIIGIVAIGVTATGVIIYKILFEDGTEMEATSEDLGIETGDDLEVGEMTHVSDDNDSDAGSEN